MQWIISNWFLMIVIVSMSCFMAGLLYVSIEDALHRRDQSTPR